MNSSETTDQVTESKVAEQNAEHFNSTAHGYTDADLIEQDAFIAGPLYDRAVAQAKLQIDTPRALDIGAGGGISSLPLLERGCHVTANDIAEEMLVTLRQRTTTPERLETVTGDGGDFIDKCASNGRKFDIVLCRALLHHLPDYLGLIESSIKVIAPGGCFISLADPMRYDSVSRFERAFAQGAYYSVRMLRGNYLQGFRTLMRRSKGELRTDLPEDNVEYHVVRNGVDQEAITKTFEDANFNCDIIPYFGGNGNKIAKPIGRALGVRSSFAVFACNQNK